MEKVIATFNSPEKAEKALLELKNNHGFNGVTVITNPITPMAQSLETRGENDPLNDFSNIANQVIDTAATAGRIVGSISGIAAVGLFSLPMMVMTPFMQRQSNNNYEDPVGKNASKTSEKQIVTVMGDSDLTTAKNILVNNGADIIRSNELL